MRRVLTRGLFGKLAAPALSHVARRANFDFDKYGKSLDDQGLLKDCDKMQEEPTATFLKREKLERKSIPHAISSSEEYQNVMRMVQQLSVRLTSEETFEFANMINHKKEWIDARILEGMNPSDALEKMKTLIRIRGCLEESPKVAGF